MAPNGDKLRQDIRAGATYLSIGFWDVLSARVAEAVGADMLHNGSFCVAAVQGVPDVGVLTPAEQLELCYKVCDAVDKPVLLDFESGFGGPGQAAYWARHFERAGVSAIHVDDEAVQSCPWIPGAERRLRRKEAQETRETIARIADARQHGLAIIARTKTMFHTGTGRFLTTPEEDEERLRQYVEAGADMAFTPQHFVARGNSEGVRRLRASLGVPLMMQFNPPGYMNIDSSSSSLAQWKFDKLFGLGVAILSVPQVYPIAYKSFQDAVKEMVTKRSAQGFEDKMLSLAEVLELTRYRDFEPR